MTEILDGYATELEAKKQSEMAQHTLRIRYFEEERRAWDSYAAAAVSGLMSQYSVNAHVYETVKRITEFAADVADKILEERKNRYGSVES
jgi:hypothetical protein